MAIRAMWGFAHLPQGAIGNNAKGYGIEQNPYGLTITTTTTGSMIVGNAFRISDAPVGSGSTTPASATVPAALITDGVSLKTWLGWRLKSEWVGSFISIAGLLFTTAEAKMVINTDYWIEFLLDRTTKEVSLFVNGAFILKKVSTIVPLLLGSVLTFTSPGGSGRYAGNLYDSFYSIDDTGDDTPCSRLGPCTVSMIDTVTATGVGWTTSGDVPLINVLNTPYTDTASLAAPLASSPPTLAPIEATVGSLPTDATDVKGVMVVMSSRRLPASAVGIDIGIKSDASVQYGSTTTYTADAITHSTSGVFQKAPDNTTWTPAKVKEITLVVKPKPV